MFASVRKRPNAVIHYKIVTDSTCTAHDTQVSRLRARAGHAVGILTGGVVMVSEWRSAAAAQTQVADAARSALPAG